MGHKLMDETGRYMGLKDMPEEKVTVRDVTGAELWPTPNGKKETAASRIDFFVRQLQAEGYTEAEIQGGLETYIYEKGEAR
jgi:hypothetical protein